MTNEYIERRIVTGFLTSKEFLDKFSTTYRPEFLQSKTARTLASWIMEYYQRYEEPPGSHIEDIYWKKLQAGLDKEQAEWIEDVLDDLDNDYDPSQLNIPFLSDETDKYFRTRAAIEHGNSIKTLAERGEIEECEALIANFHSPQSPTGCSFNLLEPDEERIKKAFESFETPLISFPGAMGDFLNNQLIQGGFVGFVGQDKVGKTFLAYQLAVRAVMQKNHVVLFEIGDMTAQDMDYRNGIYHTKKSDLKQYCGKIHIPVLDCLKNQTDECNKKERKCTFGIFEGEEDDEIKLKSKKEYLEAFYDNPKYKPCHHCSVYGINDFNGAIWYKERDPIHPLKYKEAVKATGKFLKKYKRNIYTSCHASGELRPKDIENELNIIHSKYGHMPKVVIVDYPDVMEADYKIGDKREKINQIWLGLRGISQKFNVLLIAMTHSDAKGYEQDLLNRSNFSESRTKNAHVTAMIGLNKSQRDEDLGLLRMNKFFVRRGRAESKRILHVLQCLEIGRPYLGSFY
jgi:hypothetical protein